MSTTDVDQRQLANSARKALQTSKDPVECLRCKCLMRGANGIHGFGRQFRIMDDDGNRMLSKEELTEGCKDFGLSLTTDELNTLFAALDKDGSGSISFDELLIAMRPPLNETRLNLVKKAFEKMDRTGDKKLTVDDIKKVYQVKHHPKYQTNQMTEEQILKAYLNTFEGGKGNSDGVVTWDEFLNYYSGISASVDSDAYFDLMMRKAFKL